MAPTDHNKLITAAAKKALSPLGLRQQRKSRLWYDDHGWWAIIVEFQPSSWDRGTYLNVGVSWMLYESEHWTFDIGHRIDGFRSATSAGFETTMANVAAQAANKVQEYRERFATLDAVSTYYQTIDGRGGWPDYHAGVIEGLRGNRNAAEQRFSSVMKSDATTTWHRALQYRCQDLMRLLPEPKSFRDSILGIVLRCRSGRCLDDMPVDEITLP